MIILSIDMGASSSTFFLHKDNKSEKIYEFNNYSIFSDNSHIWDIDKIINEIYFTINKVLDKHSKIDYLVTCSWGLDYILFDKYDKIIKPCYGYRDNRSKSGQEYIMSKNNINDIFNINGIQNLSYNTIYQLQSESKERLNRTKLILNISDAINYILTGIACSEISILSTTGLLDIKNRNFSNKLSKICNIENRVAKIVYPGYKLGKLLNYPNISLICGFSHDTAAAVNSIDNLMPEDLYLSCGTWSLLGCILDKPNLSDDILKLNFTNEIQNNKIRLLKNIVGLWVIQEIERETKYTYSELSNLASQNKDEANILDLSEPIFLEPDNMLSKIKSRYCKKYNNFKDNIGFIVCIVINSLIELYLKTIEELWYLTGINFKRLHVVGGGTKNILLMKELVKRTNLKLVVHKNLNSAIGNIKFINSIC